LEVHRDPQKALCDGANSLYLSELEELLTMLKQIDSLVKTPAR